MKHFTLYNFIRIITTICFLLIGWVFWEGGLLGVLFMLGPYILVIILARKTTYNNKHKKLLRASGGILVSLITLGLIQDNATAVGGTIAVVFQYGIIFISEALIGLLTYEEN